MVLDFRDPFRFNIIKTRCRNHRKANEEDVGLGVTERAKSQSKTRSRSKIPQLVPSWQILPPASRLKKKTEMYQILSQDWAWNSQVLIPKQTGKLFENSDRFTLRCYWDWSGVQSVLRRFVFCSNFQKNRLVDFQKCRIFLI